MTSWQTQVARALAWGLVLPGLGCFWLAAKAWEASGDDMLLVVMPIIFCIALGTGLTLTVGSVMLAAQLQQGLPGARLKAMLVGVLLACSGAFTMFVAPLPGLLLVLYGGMLAYCVLATPATRDLGSWQEQVPRPPAPWGSTPGTKVWSDEPVQQGPWSPDPTTVPWFAPPSSGPRVPWWQTWEAGLRRGIPLWEAVLLGLALVVFFVGLACILVTGSQVYALVAVPLPIAVVALLEKRMRQRLASRS